MELKNLEAAQFFNSNARLNGRVFQEVEKWDLKSLLVWVRVPSRLPSGLVAQLDRAMAFYSICYRFESCRGHQFKFAKLA